MNKFKKIVVVAGLSFAIITSSITTAFANQIVYEKVEDEIISSGVIHKNILRFTESGWLNLNAIYVDLKDNNIKLDVLTSSGGLSTKEPLSKMAKDNENIVGAINGDFFYMLNPDSPLGAIIKDGEVISTPITVHDYATFFINDNNEAFIDYWDQDYWKNKLYATTSSGKTIPISSINKYTDKYQYTMLIDRNWGTHSPGYSESLQDMVEVVVINDIVVEIRRKQPSIEIPEDGYILLASSAGSPWAHCDTLANNINLGDEITIHKEIQPNLENIKLAVGGGTALVKDGQVVPSFTQYVSGAHPRTAIGITQDGSKLILVTIDGRHVYYKGVDGKQMAQILIELGSYNAIMMDGGGSTTMVKRSQGEFEPKIVNNLSDGSERRITNGVAVVSKPPIYDIGGIKVEVDDKKSFVGASRKINVKAFDKNYNPLNVDYSKVNLSLKLGEGTFNGMDFTPTKSGKIIIEVEYLGIISEVELNVLEELLHIEVNPKTAKLNYGQSTSFDVTAYDAEGYKFKINAKDLAWNDTQNLGSFKNGIYTAGSKDGIAKLEAYFAGKVANVNIAIGSAVLENSKLHSESIVKDKYNKPYEIEGDKLLVHSGIKPKNYILLDKLIASKISNLINNNYKLSLFTGDLDQNLSSNIKKQIISAKSGYRFTELEDSLIIQLDNLKDGIRQTNFDQWPWLQNLVNTTNKKNIFIVMSKPIYGDGGFSDKLEAQLLMDTFTALFEKGKQVFVLYEGQNISVDIINGVRYISTGIYNSKNITNPQKAFKYIEFNINEKEVTYQIKSLFE